MAKTMLSKTKRVGALIVLLSSTACTTLQPVAEPDRFFAKESPRFVVVTTTTQEDDEPPMVFNSPRFDGGTLSGLVMGENRTVPVTEVRTIAASQVNRRRTTFAIGLGTVVIGSLIYMAATSGDGYSEYHCEPPCRGIPDPALIPANR